MLLHGKDFHHFQQFFIEINQNTRKRPTQNDTKNTSIPDSDVPDMHSRWNLFINMISCVKS